MARPDGRAVTLNDVAEASGVSYQTVSRVVNRSPHVASDTRRRVLDAIAKLGYRPNTAARQLVTGRSNSVGIVSFGTHLYGPAQTVFGVERALKARGYGFVPVSIDDLSVDQIRRGLGDLGPQRVDGLILVTPLVDADLGRIRTLGTGRPLVTIGVDRGPGLPAVLIDQETGASLAVRHLLDLGHRRVHEISGPLDWWDAAARHRGWRRTLEEAGLPPGRSVEGDWSAASGYRAARALLDTGDDVRAVVIGNDPMALGAIHAFAERGLRVPGDVSVVGFDDVPEAAYYLPALTTVRQDFAALGRTSADVVLDLIEGEEATGPVLLRPELVLRDSTAAPPAEASGGARKGET